MEGTEETARDDLRIVRDREVPGSHPGPLTMTRGVIIRLRAGVRNSIRPASRSLATAIDTICQGADGI